MQKDWLGGSLAQSKSEDPSENITVISSYDPEHLEKLARSSHFSLDKSQTGNKDIPIEHFICLITSKPTDDILGAGIIIGPSLVLASIHSVLRSLDFRQSLRLSIVASSKSFIVTKIDVSEYHSKTLGSFGPHDWVLIHIRPEFEDEDNNNEYLRLEAWEEGPFPELLQRNLEEITESENYFYSHIGSSKAFFEPKSIMKLEGPLAIHASASQILPGAPLMTSFGQNVIGLHLSSSINSPEIAESLLLLSPIPFSPIQEKIKTCQNKKIADPTKATGLVSFFAEPFVFSGHRKTSQHLMSPGDSYSVLSDQIKSSKLKSTDQISLNSPLLNSFHFVLYWYSPHFIQEPE